MQLLFAVVWLFIIVFEGGTVSTNEEAAPNSHEALELQEPDSAEGNAITVIKNDVEESKSMRPPSLENDTNVNYVKNISEDKMAEVDFSTHSPIEITSTLPTSDNGMRSEIEENLESKSIPAEKFPKDIHITTNLPKSGLEQSNDWSGLESDFDKLKDTNLKDILLVSKGNPLLTEVSVNDVNLANNYMETTTVEFDLDKMVAEITNNDSNVFKENAINENIIIDRLGLAADYADDYPNHETAKVSSWKPIWPYAANPSIVATPQISSNPSATVINNAGTTIKPYRKTENIVSKEPITAYYFDINNTPIPAVGPLYEPTDIYGYNISNEPHERQHPYNVTDFLANDKSLAKTTDFIIETTPIINLSSIQDSSKLSNNVYNILNDGFDQDREEFSVTFSTVLPAIKDSIPTMAVEELHPKRVTESGNTVMAPMKPGIQSSIMDISSGESSSKITTALNSSPLLMSIAPTTSVSKFENNNTRTPLWVRLSGQSTSLVNATSIETEDLQKINNTLAPSPNNPVILINDISSTFPVSETILSMPMHSIQNKSKLNSKNIQESGGELNAQNTLVDVNALEISDLLLNNSVATSFSTSNSSSTSHSTHSTSNSTTNVSVSEKKKLYAGNSTTPIKNDINLNLESSIRRENMSGVVSETPVITPTNLNTEILNMGDIKSVLLLETKSSTESTPFTLPSTVEANTSTDIIIKDKGITIKKAIINNTAISSESEQNNMNENFARNLTRAFDETEEDFQNPPRITENSYATTGPIKSENRPSNEQTTEFPILESTTSQDEDEEVEYEDYDADALKNFQLPSLTPNINETLLHYQNETGNSILNNDAKSQVPGEMILPTTVSLLPTEFNEEGETSTHVSILSNEGNMIKTVIKHLRGKSEPELKIIKMHSNGTNVSIPSPYLKADLSYGVQEFCRHQGNIRSLLGEWINSHLKNETDSYSYEVEFFAQPNCSNLSQFPEDDAKSKTVLYFYVMDDGELNPKVTRLYPKNPTNLEINKKLDYLKEKILHLELVNAISSSEDLALEEAAVGTSIIAIIISMIILLFVVISAALTYIIIKRRRANDQSHGRRCTPAANDTYSMDSVSVFYHSFKRKSRKRASNKSLRSYLNQGFDDPNGPSRQLNFGKLTHFISDTEGIYDEFLKIPSVTPKYEEMPRGVEDKNRYANVIPVPETRVFLEAKVQTPIEEYINANYVHGARGESNYYIAAQAPLDETVPDFWQMIWEQESKVIVMLTDFVEKGIDKCADYLPPSETLDCHRVYGDFQVTLKSRDMREKYVVSQVQLKNLENNLVREIAHMWFTGWPYIGIPNEEKTFISYIFETRAMRKKLRAKGPIIVHCSPGTGRTGTFIACDISMRNFDDQKSVDIPKTVWRIRRERAGAVQTKEQYSFIYRVTNLYAAKLMTGNLDLF